MEQGGWLFAPKALIKTVGAMPALLFGLLLDYHEHHADKEGWFYVKNKLLAETLGTSEHILRQAFASLQQAKFLGCKSIVGGANHYKFLELAFEPLKYLNPSNISTPQNITPPEETDHPKILTPQNIVVPPLKNLSTPPQNFEGVPLEKFEEYPLKNLSTYKEYTNKEESNKDLITKNKEEKKEADFLQNPISRGKVKKVQNFNFSIPTAEMVQAWINEFYPNELKGWGDKLINYIINIKPQAMKRRKKIVDFVANCYDDVRKVLDFAKIKNLSDFSITEQIETCTLKVYESLAHSNFDNCMLGFERRAPKVDVSDALNSRENFLPFYDNVLLVYKKKFGDGLVRSSPETERQRQINHEYWGLFRAAFPQVKTDAELLAKIKDVSECLLREAAASKTQAAGKTYLPQTFENWLKCKKWELFPSKQNANKTAQKPQNKPATQLSTQTYIVAPTVQEDAPKAGLNKGFVFVWDDTLPLPDFRNPENFKKGSGITKEILAEHEITEPHQFEAFIIKNFVIRPVDARDVVAKLKYMLVRTDEATTGQSNHNRGVEVLGNIFKGVRGIPEAQNKRISYEQLKAVIG